MENKITKEQLEKIKTQIEEQLAALKEIYEQDMKRISAYAPCITLLDAQHQSICKEINEFDNKPKEEPKA